jgi:hypothetical protein
MKNLAILLMLFTTSFSFASEFNLTNDDLIKNYKEGSLPNFEPYLGTALPGRCFFKTPTEKQTASTLVIRQAEEGLMIAPLSADKREANFFDKLSYDVIFSRFPQTTQLSRIVHFGSDEAIINRQKKDYFFQASIREFADIFFVRVILNKHSVRYCYYQKN